MLQLSRSTAVKVFTSVAWQLWRHDHGRLWHVDVRLSTCRLSSVVFTLLVYRLFPPTKTMYASILLRVAVKIVFFAPAVARVGNERRAAARQVRRRHA